VFAGPGVAGVVDDPVSQQQLGKSVPGTHQVTAAVLPGPDQIVFGPRLDSFWMTGVLGVGVLPSPASFDYAVRV
jgi:hypothetical protein